jgi:hypothetical protein
MLLTAGQHCSRHVGTEIVTNQHFDLVPRELLGHINQEHLKKVCTVTFMTTLFTLCLYYFYTI